MDGKDIFGRMKAGGIFHLDEPELAPVMEFVTRTQELSVQLNASTNIDDVRERLAEIIGSSIDGSTRIFPPFHTNFGRFISLGKNVFINHACSFLDLGGTSFETTAPAATTLFLPMVTPGNIVAAAPIHALRLITIGMSRRACLSAGSKG